MQVRKIHPRIGMARMKILYHTFFIETVLVLLEKFLEMASEQFISEVISSFKCSRDSDIEEFLKNSNKAILYEKKSKSRTYLIFDGEGLIPWRV